MAAAENVSLESLLANGPTSEDEQDPFGDDASDHLLVAASSHPQPDRKELNRPHIEDAVGLSPPSANQLDHKLPEGESPDKTPALALQLERVTACDRDEREDDGEAGSAKSGPAAVACDRRQPRLAVNALRRSGLGSFTPAINNTAPSLDPAAASGAGRHLVGNNTRHLAVVATVAVTIPCPSTPAPGAPASAAPTASASSSPAVPIAPTPPRPPSRPIIVVLRRRGAASSIRAGAPRAGTIRSRSPSPRRARNPSRGRSRSRSRSRSRNRFSAGLGRAGSNGRMDHDSRGAGLAAAPVLTPHPPTPVSNAKAHAVGNGAAGARVGRAAQSDTKSGVKPSSAGRGQRLTLSTSPTPAWLALNAKMRSAERRKDWLGVRNTMTQLVQLGLAQSQDYLARA
jgi:hypothetical protein